MERGVGIAGGWRPETKPAAPAGYGVAVFCASRLVTLKARQENVNCALPAETIRPLFKAAEFDFCPFSCSDRRENLGKLGLFGFYNTSAFPGVLEKSLPERQKAWKTGQFRLTKKGRSRTDTKLR